MWVNKLFLFRECFASRWLWLWIGELNVIDELAWRTCFATYCLPSSDLLFGEFLFNRLKHFASRWFSSSIASIVDFSFNANCTTMELLCGCARRRRFILMCRMSRTRKPALYLIADSLGKFYCWTWLLLVTNFGDGIRRKMLASFAEIKLPEEWSSLRCFPKRLIALTQLGCVTLDEFFTINSLKLS